MFAYEELKERVPESEEIMTGEEAIKYFKDKTRRKPKPDYYELIFTDISKKVKIEKGLVLDIGCGSGGLLREIQRSNPNLKLFGIDGSKTLLNASKKRFQSKGIKLKYSKAENIKFEDNKFDLVICQDTFHHFTNPVQVMKEIFRVTKKGGNIYITDLRRDVKKEIIELATKGIIKSSVTHTIFYLTSLKAAYTLSEIRSLLKEAKIKNFKIHNGRNEKHISNLIKKISEKDRKEGLDKAFKERWFALIKK